MPFPRTGAVRPNYADDLAEVVFDHSERFAKVRVLRDNERRVMAVSESIVQQMRGKADIGAFLFGIVNFYVG